MGDFSTHLKRIGYRNQNNMSHENFPRHGADPPGDERRGEEGDAEACALGRGAPPNRPPRHHPHLCHAHVLCHLRTEGNHQNRKQIGHFFQLVSHSFLNFI